MCGWIVKNLGPDVPIHFSRFFPYYKLKDLPPTPVETLQDALKAAQDAGCGTSTSAMSGPGPRNALPPVPEAHHRADRIPCAADQYDGREVPALRHRHPGVWS